MIFFCLYLVLCFEWAIFAVKEQKRFYNKHLFIAFIVHFLFTPITLLILIKNYKKYYEENNKEKQ